MSELPPLEVPATIVFKTTEDAYMNPDINILVHQGGSRSSKTFNILIWLISKCQTQWKNKSIDIVRKSFPTLRQSVMSDFLELLQTEPVSLDEVKNGSKWGFGIYSEKHHNKTENSYMIGTNKFRFFSCDEPQKMRGPGRDILFINEVNEDSLEDFRQLNMRTREFTIVDYNPSDEFHWLYDHVLTRDDVAFHKTTFLDNPFLPHRIKNEILRYKETDENYWRIYGLGERGVSGTTIYTKWNLCDSVPDCDNVYYGLDFGYNHPTVLTKLTLLEDEAYIEEKFYQSHLTSDDIIKKLKDLEIPSSALILADSARPEMIAQIYSAGFNCQSVKKGPDSVKAGIDLIKKHKVFITKDSINIIKEIKSYKWKVNKEGKPVDEPVKLNDDAMDAMRYAFNTLLNQSPEVSTIDDIDFLF